MRKVLCFAALLLATYFTNAQPFSFHDYGAKTITEDSISLSQYYGKKVMVVNTASFCVFTPQFDDLEQLYTQYHQYNFEILGFPCNDFNNQDPHDDSTILDFCTNNYDVTFQMMSKVQCITGDTAPVYKWLQRADLNGVQNAHVSWNFNKFLIDEAGHWVRHFESTTNPMDTAITNWIMSPSVVSGIKENELDNAFDFKSPNPAGNSLDFTLIRNTAEDFSIKLLDVNGRVLSVIYNGAGSAGQSINYSLSEVPSGVYLIQIAQAGRTQVRRQVVIK